jgi:hypothetical protein
LNRICQFQIEIIIKKTGVRSPLSPHIRRRSWFVGSSNESVILILDHTDKTRPAIWKFFLGLISRISMAEIITVAIWQEKMVKESKKTFDNIGASIFIIVEAFINLGPWECGPAT